MFYTFDNRLTWLKTKPSSADPAYTGNIVNGYRHYPWAVPVVTKNKKAKTKVVGFTGANGAGTKVAQDITDVPIVLRTVQVLSPNGGRDSHRTPSLRSDGGRRRDQKLRWEASNSTTRRIIDSPGH